MPADVEEITRRFGALKKRREFWHNRWQDIADFMHPGRATSLTQLTSKPNHSAQTSGVMGFSPKRV